MIFGGGFLALCFLLAIWVIFFPTQGMKESRREHLLEESQRRRTTQDRKQDQRKKQDASDREFGAWIMAQDFVEQRLKTPSTAKFPLQADRILRSSEGCFIVSSYVDAQNNYGAMVRTHFLCEVCTADGNTWTLKSLSME